MPTLICLLMREMRKIDERGQAQRPAGSLQLMQQVGRNKWQCDCAFGTRGCVTVPLAQVGVWLHLWRMGWCGCAFGTRGGVTTPLAQVAL
eukprot:1162051-Pelagomonas_calceolata.AAC.12